MSDRLRVMFYQQTSTEDYKIDQKAHVTTTSKKIMKLVWTQDEKTVTELPEKHYDEHQVNTAWPRRERTTQQHLEKRSGKK